MSKKNKIALVTGGSSGIGKQTALALRARGCTVYEMSRKPSDIEGLTHLTGDVTDEASVRAAVGEIIAREGRIDILVNNAGFGISGATEFTELDAAKKQMDVNFFGMVNVCRAVIPHMREAGGGKIVNISSVAAVTPIPFQTFYSASKAAINAYSLALANEVLPFGISVCAIMPGDIKTNFTAMREKQCIGDDVYGGRISRSVARMEHDEQNGMSPEIAGRYIAKISAKRRIKPLYAIRADYKLVAVLAKLLPARLLNYILGKLYAR
ncbi:MAG: SDR family oxidoreductase [Clostridia bacterium]|nr:SDR family oxidoreductase [Clostridia bacterium]